jgi:pyridoxal-phosphate dependent TrpB-like enzyme
MEPKMTSQVMDQEYSFPTVRTQGSGWIPSRWFNVLPHLPEPLPEVREPADGGESRIEIQKRIRLASVQAQDRSLEPWIDIPAKVLEKYEEIGRPTALTRARSLERYLDTPASIFIKREDLLPTGSFKLNSSLAQAYFAHAEGVGRLVTETGAGQWGHAVAYSCRFFGIESVIFWAGVSERQKQSRSLIVRMLGGVVHPSPSRETAVGRAILEKGEDSLGSLGTAIGEAISFAKDHSDFRYISGSNLPHILLHQSVIGLETKHQLEELGEKPDVLIACVGGGSNLGGFMNPFLPERLAPGSTLRFLAAEAASAPRLTQGAWRYDHADPEGITPLSKSYTLGRDYLLPETHVGGLRQHNGSPVIGVLRQRGLLEACAYAEKDVFETGRLFLRLEGIVAAPESCHALRAAVDEALAAKQRRKKETIVVCLSGSGLLDLGGYAANLQVKT